MSKTQKFSEDLLLEAVVKFSEIEQNKIKATELAKWANDNIKGLEEVRDYHFTRPMKDGKTGKLRQKLCTLKMEEINKTRSIAVSVNTNLLLKASNIEMFMELTDSTKRKMIVETREVVDKLIVQNYNLKRENEVLREANKIEKMEIEQLQAKLEKIDEFQKAQNKFGKMLRYLLKVTDENMRKQMLSEMGISDETVDLMQYEASLQKDLSDLQKMSHTLRKQTLERRENVQEINLTDNIQANDIQTENLVDNIISGIDFGGE